MDLGKNRQLTSQKESFLMEIHKTTYEVILHSPFPIQSEWNLIKPLSLTFTLQKNRNQGNMVRRPNMGMPSAKATEKF